MAIQIFGSGPFFVAETSMNVMGAPNGTGLAGDASGISLSLMGAPSMGKGGISDSQDEPGLSTNQMTKSRADLRRGPVLLQ